MDHTSGAGAQFLMRWSSMLKKMSLVDLIKYLVITLEEIVTVIAFVLCYLLSRSSRLNLSVVI